jgi:two-component system, OmpR family, response regulator
MGHTQNQPSNQGLTGITNSGFVAVVDDDEHIAQAIAMWLDMLGTHSQVFSSGESLFSSLNTNRPEQDFQHLSSLKAAILDLNLPGSNGIEIANRLRSTIPNLPIVLVSAMNAEDLSKFGKLPEGVRFFKKPFELEDLESALQLQQ